MSSDIPREEEHDILFGIINRFIGYFTRQAVANTINDTSREYPFVAMDTRQAYHQITIARDTLEIHYPQKERFSFIDIGCGIGNIMLLAELMDFSVFGIEKDSASATIAAQLVGSEAVGRDDIWQFTRWADFDVVYYFRPFCEKTTQLTFERLVETSMRSGAILIANRKMDQSIDTNGHFSRIEDDWPVWLKR